MTKILSWTTIIVLFVCMFVVAALVVAGIIFFYPCRADIVCEAYINQTYAYCIEKTIPI